MSTLIQQKRYLLRLICLILWSILRGSFLYAQTDSVKILLNQAEQFIKMDSLDKGIRIAHLAFDKANTEGSVWGAGEAMRIIGSAYRQNDKPAKADEYLTKAVRIFEKTTFYERHARCLALLGRVKQGQRNFAEATELYTQSLAIYNQKLSPEEMVLYRDLKAFILERMTVILSNQKQYDQAETYATEAYNLCEQVGDKGRWEITATAVGNVYFWKKNYEKAAFYYQKAYELAKDIGRNTGRTLNNLGIVASKAGQLDKAIDYYTEAIEQYQKIGGTDMIAQTQINIAELNNDKGNYDRAIKLATLGTQTIAKSKTITGLTEGYEVLLTAYIKSNDLPRALDVQRQYSFLKDSLSNSSRKKEMLEAQVKFETERKDKEIQLLSKEKLLSDLQLQQKNFDLINQKLSTERNAKSIALLQQAKVLQESELARTTAELEKEKQIGLNKNAELVLSQQEIKINKQEAEVQSKNNAILRGSLLAVLCIGLLLWQLLRYRQRIKHEREELANFRLLEVNKKLLYETELRALGAQMNPHFIFNCLNSIKLYTLENDSITAADYLSKFSRLIRMVLENSRSEKITLDEELETLQLYMDMEAMRFKNKVKYTIDVAKTIDQQFIEIPPLLLQPYVENAVWHGLMHREQGGTIHIEVTQPHENTLHVVITDNGIGRKAAADLKSKSATKKKSLGMQMTTERIDLINQNLKNQTQVQVIDLENTEGVALGTKVIIEIQI